ncbi:hypothetical protein AR158_C471L [Paramecium bursaria Chlorella virus AR158]|uniref:hypothetical protein n=1 Tax=Paramecium bursaria Chlorella virus AR158 TaxID=380598 RepID=UPI00015AA6F6|nr:hypothetical protein AR158_C471L [Paramecium bursaria Chlorella virus AR158]ABU44016.1 hypothetical protein AR158_C471L [Paramecium bursaria Chlorella virus AR158]
MLPIRSPFFDNWQIFFVPNFTMVLNLSSKFSIAKFVYRLYFLLNNEICGLYVRYTSCGPRDNNCTNVPSEKVPSILLSSGILSAFSSFAAIIRSDV